MEFRLERFSVELHRIYRFEHGKSCNFLYAEFPFSEHRILAVCLEHHKLQFLSAKFALSERGISVFEAHNSGGAV